MLNIYVILLALKNVYIITRGMESVVRSDDAGTWQSLGTSIWILYSIHRKVECLPICCCVDVFVCVFSFLLPSFFFFLFLFVRALILSAWRFHLLLIYESESSLFKCTKLTLYGSVHMANGVCQLCLFRQRTIYCRPK